MVLTSALLGDECRGANSTQALFGRIRTNFYKKSIDFWSTLIYIFDSILQGWDYLAFSSPSAPSPAFFMRRKSLINLKP
jgi:hypothetical protein